MNSNIYFIIGGVAIVFIIYMIFLQRMMKKKNQQQLESFNINHSGNPLTEAQKRLLTFGAILFYNRMEKILGIAPEKQLATYAHGLSQQWEISNSAEAKETLNDLLALQRSTEFAPIIEQATADVTKIQKQIAKGLGIELSVVEQTKSAYGWDICRVVALAKWCYWCGYLTEAETWDIMNKAAVIANQHGKNWTDYTVSFLLGRTIQGFDLDDLIIEAKQILSGKGPALRKIEDTDVYMRYSFS